MQCSACNAVFDDSLDRCPHCRVAASESPNGTAEVRPLIAQPKEATHKGSTLIEFPGNARAPQPAWRKELSARVREIQERRAREAARAEERRESSSLNLISKPETPTNPIVAAALRRLERARQQPVAYRTSSGRAAAALARVQQTEEKAAAPQKDRRPQLASPQTEQPAPLPESPQRKLEQPKQKTADSKASRAIREVVARSDATEAHTPLRREDRATEHREPLLRHEASQRETATAPRQEVSPHATDIKAGAPRAPFVEGARPQPRRVFDGVLDDALIARLEAEQEEQRRATSIRQLIDDRAPFSARMVAAAVDLLVVAFFSSPFAAVIEITSSNWADPRVRAIMLGICLSMTFLYFVAAVTFAGRTFGMWLVSVRVVDAKTGLIPTFGQAARRALALMLSLATFGLGLFYSLVNAEGRALHDLLSGTIVVRE